MTDRHRHPPIPFRPQAQDREWLLAYSKAIGIPVNRILADALTVFRAQLAPHLAEHENGQPSTST